LQWEKSLVILGKPSLAYLMENSTSVQALQGWMEKAWKPLLSYLPEAFVLAHGWNGFILKSHKDCETLLKKNWEWGPSALTLKEWTVDFDPMRELVDKKKVWAILPELPLAFWSKEALEAIGNKIGIFIKLEPNWFTKPNRRWAWVQVEVDTREGLVSSMDLVMGSKIWHQKVDYWRIPFR
jgi:hypothetical protein